MKPCRIVAFDLLCRTMSESIRLQVFKINRYAAELSGRIVQNEEDCHTKERQVQEPSSQYLLDACHWPCGHCVERSHKILCWRLSRLGTHSLGCLGDT